jgi:glutamyl-Q tRNA(Asp) synthetase
VVTRGADLFAATHIHRLLQVLLGLPEPRWHHHPLLTGPDGRKLAKRRDAPSLADRRRAGRMASHLPPLCDLPALTVVFRCTKA